MAAKAGRGLQSATHSHRSSSSMSFWRAMPKGRTPEPRELYKVAVSKSPAFQPPMVDAQTALRMPHSSGG
jgi:hypothetical protein